MASYRVRLSQKTKQNTYVNILGCAGHLTTGHALKRNYYTKELLQIN